MKKILIALVALIAITGTTNAQTSKRIYTIEPANEVSVESKAFKNFRRAYPGVSNEKWHFADNHYFVSFALNNVKNKVVYNRDGNIDYTLRVSSEKMLPESIRSAIKSTYYDFNITNVQELTLKSRVIYLTKITDGETWKTIRAAENGIEEIESYYNAISPCR